MAGHLTYKQYRRIDLVLFAVILIVFERIVYTAAAKWYPDQLYSLSIVPAIVALVIMRWGWFGMIHAVLGGFIYCYVARGTVMHFMCYIAGNAFCFIPVLFVRTVGKDKVRANSVVSALYAVLVALSMQVGRAFIGMVLGNPVKDSFGFILTDILSGLFAILIVLIARKLDGMFEDQKSYLLRVHEEPED